MTKLKIGLDARDVKDALRKRHPAYEMMYVGVGRWTCIEEWNNIDLLALDAWAEGRVVGYEVKVSRSDMRSELLDPTKRAAAVAMCTQFYFATPAGLLKPEERDFQEPEWGPEDFQRAPCTNPDCRAGQERRGFRRSYPKARGPRLRGTTNEGVTVQVSSGYDWSGACCVVCRGYGAIAKSRVELEAPMLWIPRDVGLVVVGPGGCSVIREAPRRKITEPLVRWPYGSSRLPAEDASRLQRAALAQLVRWVSARPDPRHAERGRNLSE